MTYKVTGMGPGPDDHFSYNFTELWEAAYQAAKLSDQGARGVRVLDDAGKDVDISNAPLPPGWRRGPFRRSDFP